MKIVIIDGIKYKLVPVEDDTKPSENVYVSLVFQIGDRFEFTITSFDDSYIMNQSIGGCIKDYNEGIEWDNHAFIESLYADDFTDIPEVVGQDLTDLKAILKLAKPYWEGKPLLWV